MNTTTKLLIPIGLGLAAAALNFAVLSQKDATVAFTVIDKPLTTNQTFTRDNLRSYNLPAEFAETLRSTAVPFSECGMLMNARTERNLNPGDLVFYRDVARSGSHLKLRPGESAVPVSIEGIPLESGIVRVGNEIDFRIAEPSGDGTSAKWLGPFRVVTVGTDFSPRQEKKANIGNSNFITIAASRQNPTKAYKELEMFLDGQRGGTAASLVNVRLHGSSSR